MKKTTLSALVMLFACLTLNALNSPTNETTKPLVADNITEDNASATVNLNGFLFEFLGVQYNTDGTSTWTYKVTGVGARRNLSHWKLKFFDEHNALSSTPNTWEVHVDPHFEYYGIKWDSSVHKNGGTRTFSFTLDGRYDVGDVDFGYKSGRKLFHGIIQGPTNPSTNSISGTVFNDTNTNGIQDGVEGFLANVQINLYDDANGNGLIDAGESVSETTTTDGVGGYIFDDTSVLNAMVEAVLPSDTSDFSYQATTPLITTRFLAANDVMNVDFGIKRSQIAFYDISGVVYDDNNQNGMNDSEAGLSAVVVKMYNDTNANGSLDAGELQVATTTTDVNGAYTFTSVTYTHVIIEVVVPGDSSSFDYIATTDMQEAITMLNQNIINVNFGIFKVQQVDYNIFGTVYDDDNENAALDTTELGRLANVTLTLYVDDDSDGRVGSGDTVIETTTTAADGTYSFLNITIENTVVAVTVPPNTTDNTYVLTTVARLDTSSIRTGISDANFGINKVSTTYTVSGNVFSDDNADGVNATAEAGLNGVTINLFDDVNGNGRVDRGEPLIATTASDRSGNYQFGGVTAPNVIVQMVLPSNTSQYTYTPTTPVSVVLSGGVSTTVDFGINRQLVVLYNVLGVVWDDQNSDQLKDAYEPRLAGIGVTLFEDVNANGILDASDISRSTIVTSSNGGYQFTGVSLQNVLVVPTIPSNGTFTTPNTRAISSINTDVIDMDFGISVASTLYQIIGVVFDDQNENGIIDTGEDAIDGLPVEIYADSDASGTLDPNIDLLVAFTQTSNSGFGFLNPNYLVDDVPPGQVFIRIVIPDDTIFLTYTPTYDPDTGTSAPDGIFPTLMTANITNINFGLKITNSNPMSRESNDTDVVSTDGNTIHGASEDVSGRLRLYPNPTVRQIAINAEEFAGDVTVEIYNDRGYSVLTTTVSPFGNELKVDVQRLAPGMYYAKFGSRNKVASKKFIKK